MPPQKFYAVRQGRQTGIFSTWDDVKRLVDGYPGAQHKSFRSRQEAEAYLAELGPAQPPLAGSERGSDGGAYGAAADYDYDHGYYDDVGGVGAPPTQRRAVPSSVIGHGGGAASARPSAVPLPLRHQPYPQPSGPVWGAGAGGSGYGGGGGGGGGPAARPYITSATVGGAGGPSRFAVSAGGSSGGGGGGSGRFAAVVEGPTQPVSGERLYQLEFDGASRGNPGESGCGAVLRREDSGVVVCRLRKYMGRPFTNNEAEYTALLEGLRMARQLGVRRLKAQGDSQLVVSQVEGVWAINKPHLRALCEAVRAELGGFVEFAIKQVPREWNRDADKLSNDAIDMAYT